MATAAVTDKSHLYLIDASAYIFRAFHALPPLTRKSDGLPVGAVAGWIVLAERLSATQWLAMGFIMAASMGAAWSAGRGQGAA